MRNLYFAALALCLLAQLGLANQDDSLFKTEDLSLPVGADPYSAPQTIGQKLATYNAQSEDEPVNAVHVVLVTDTDAIGLVKSVQRDHAAMKQLFSRGFADTAIQVKFYEFADGELTPHNVVRTIAALRLGVKDTLVVYFAGHGELVTTDEVIAVIPNVNGPRKVFRSHHVLKIGDNRLARANIRSAMERTGARLQVLLADACRPLPPGAQPGRAPLNPEFKPRTKLDTENVNKVAFSQLFAFQSGIIDVSTGVALADPDRGGVLTQCFVAACCYHNATVTLQPRARPPAAVKKLRIARTKIDRNGDNFINWREFMGLWLHLIVDYSGAEQSAAIDIR